MEEMMNNNVVEETINDQVTDTGLTDVCVPNDVSVIPVEPKSGIHVLEASALIGGAAAVAYGCYKLAKWGGKKLKKRFGKKYAKPESDSNADVDDPEAAVEFEDCSVDEEPVK